MNNSLNRNSRFPVAFLAVVVASLGAFATPASARAAANPAPAAVVSTSTVDHGAYDKLLKKYVNTKGRVNYKAWKGDQDGLNSYLAMLSKNAPAASWTKAEQMAYWINAYNAYTIRLVLDHYPIGSIKDIGSKIKIPFVTTPWAIKFFSIGGEKMSLDNIEHGILRKKFDDPRIHFALVCASISCPTLRNEAYTADKLDKQLNAQAEDFLNDSSKNKISKSTAQLSNYFNWYKGDWNENGQSVVKWVNKYSNTKMDDNTKISYMGYNWNLNEQ